MARSPARSGVNRTTTSDGPADVPLASLVGTRACSAFTAFSSFADETVRLVEDGISAAAAVNAAGNRLGSLAAVVLAWAATTPV